MLKTIPRVQDDCWCLSAPVKRQETWQHVYCIYDVFLQIWRGSQLLVNLIAYQNTSH